MMKHQKTPETRRDPQTGGLHPLPPEIAERIRDEAEQALLAAARLEVARTRIW